MVLGAFWMVNGRKGPRGRSAMKRITDLTATSPVRWIEPTARLRPILTHSPAILTHSPARRTVQSEGELL